MIDPQSPLDELYHRRTDFFMAKSSLMSGMAVGGVGIGLVLMIIGFRIDPIRTWGVICLNNLFFFLLSLGGVVFGLIQDACGAQWSRSIKRFHETFGVFFHVSCLIFLLMLGAIYFRVLEAHSLYIWISDPTMLDYFVGKNEWLVEDFFIIRVAVMLIVMSGVVWWCGRQNRLADRSFLAGHIEDAKRLSQLASERLRFWSSPCLVVLGVLFTFVMIDLVMSLSPLWFSTLWAGWLFSVLMQLTLCVTILGMFMIKNTPLGSLITQNQLHDMGKLIHGFCAFWAYLTFAHVLTYWYGNIPEETEYFLHRLHQPWLAMMIVTAVGAFVIPFFALIPKASKWRAGVMVPLAVMMIFCQWLAHIVMVQPEVVRHTQLGYSLLFEIAGFVIFICLFVGCIYMWGRHHLMVALCDPDLEKSLSSSSSQSHG